MVSTANSSAHEQWHSLFSAVLNGTMNESEHEQLANLLRSSAEARQLWFVYTDIEIGLSEIGLSEVGKIEATPPASPATQTRFIGLAVSWAVGCVLVWVLFTILTSTAKKPPGKREVVVRPESDSNALAPTTEEAIRESARQGQDIHESLIDQRRDEREREAIRESENARTESVQNEARKPISEEQLHRESKRELESAPSNMELSKSPARDWPRVSAAISPADLLYFVEKGKLIELNLNDGSRRTVGDAAWTNATAMDVMTSDSIGIRDDAPKGLLFIIDQGRLFEVNLANGSRRRLGERQWSDSDTIVTSDDSLFVFGADTSYRVDISDGKHEQF
jgi:hypothetical protein